VSVRRIAAVAVAGLLCAAAHAEPEASPRRPKVYALVSAVGDQFSYVQQREQVGTLFEPYVRHTARVPGDALNAAVLRGLDRVVAQDEPGSERVFVRLNPEELANVAAEERERVAIGKLVRALEQLPDRQRWDRIVAVTPAFVRSERRGMGSKLQGIGVFVQPLERARIQSLATIDPDTQSPAGEATRSSVYVAPFFYTRLWILDARTLEVLESEGRYDYRKLWDPLWTALDVSKNLTPEQLAGEVEAFVELASARALRETIGTVTVSDPKEVPSASAAETRK
jgi:hypothetical protein